MIKDYTNYPIIIIGVPRSGTSMVAGIINICGAWKGNTGGFHKYNVKGMFENYIVREKLIKPILRNMKVDPLGQYPLPETNNIKIPVDFKAKMMGILAAQEWDYKTPWMIKEPKITLIWPVIHYHFPNAKWVIVRRKTPDIINSCIRTGFMRAYSKLDIQQRVKAKDEKEGWLYWVHKHEEKFVELIQEGANVKVVWPERMINSDYGQIKDTIEWLGLDWKEKDVIDFIEPKLWKARRHR